MEGSRTELRFFIALRKTEIKLQVFFRREGGISKCEAVSEANHRCKWLITVQFGEVWRSHCIGHTRIQCQVVRCLNAAREVRGTQ